MSKATLPEDPQKLLLAAMCQKLAAWDDWGDGRGEIVVDGLRYVTELDDHGCPFVNVNEQERLRRVLLKQNAEL
jgi:hypothetical protein